METWLRTDKDLTIADRLIPRGKTYWLEPNVISSLSIIPFGAEIRRNFLDPLLHSKEVVVWRNHEASYDVALLEPITPRIFWTYVLQEYFIPVSKFEEFVPKMREVFKKNNVNVINVSIRHAMPDTGSFLAWAPEEVFSFVVYYKQGTSSYAKQSVAKWTREMIGAALSVNGRYYLPYQIHASQEQFEKAYPGFKKYAEVKKKYDPTYRFKNKLWDKYYK
jgi:FAD/FMN-containing dehydrogenase